MHKTGTRSDADQDRDDADTDLGAESAATSDLPARVDSRSPLPPLLHHSSSPVAIAESLRGVVNRHELRTGSPVPQSIAVTSALPGEGVTTISQCLATMIAHEMGHLVCWVDFSWLAGHDVVDSERPSLTELLGGRSRIASAFQSDPELPELVALQPGPVPERERNMILRSPEFERLIGLLTEEFDHIVFDIPPVLSHTTALALLRLSDTSLFVVKHRSTSVAQFQRAFESTQPTPNLGVVLNQFSSRIPARLRRLLGD